ncbi:MAG TPA: hypothetical protein VIW24_11085 [Aldersonia sp.]
MNTARVWLAAVGCGCAEPVDAPTVRDDQMRTWRPERGAVYRSGRRYLTWDELRVRFDLVEVAAS